MREMEYKKMVSEYRRHFTFLQIIYLFAIIAVAGLILVLATVPPVSRDALTHHLYIPKLFLENGGIYEIPDIEFSYYPMNLDILYMIPLYFKNDIVPKYIHFTFALITAALIWRYLKKRLNLEYALLGSLFFLSLPMVVRLSSTAYVDLGLICFTFASLLFIFEWIEKNFSFKYLLISAIFCGLGLGTKYNGLIGLLLLGLFIPFVYARYHSGTLRDGMKAVFYCTAFVSISLIVFSPWMIRNAIWTGNPIYPLYDSVFNPKPQNEEKIAETVIQKRIDMSHIEIRRQIYGEAWWEIALIPLRVFFQGKDDVPKYFDGKINPFLLLLSIFAFLGIKTNSRHEKTEKMMMLFLSILFLFYACAIASVRIRYFSPILPPLVVLSVFGLYNIRTFIANWVGVSDGFKKSIVFLLVALMFFPNANYIATRFKIDKPIAYISGEVSRDEYIQAFRPEYASFQYANRNLTKDSKILGLYIGDRGYYSDIPISFNMEIIQQLAAKVSSAKDISENLLERNFTHILVNYSLFNYWVQKYSLHEKRILKAFFDDYVVTEFSKDGCGLLRLIR